MCVCVCVCVCESVSECGVYREVSLKGLWSTICCVATDLTRIGDIETMELVQPVGNGLERERERERDRQTDRQTEC